MKATCPHCRACVSVPREYAIAKIKCPKCKQAFCPTRPTTPKTATTPGLSATPLSASGPAILPDQQVGFVGPTMKTCENCERTIGKLEETFKYKGHTICSECNGHLASGRQSVSVEGGHITTERTVKKWKKEMLIGCCLIIIGLMLGSALLLSSDSHLVYVGYVVAGIGFMVLLKARIAAWWHHG